MESIQATFDGQVFRPDIPIRLEPNTKVRITIESDSAIESGQVSFLQTAKELQLDGPPDWSENLDDDLYGDKQ